MSSERTRILVSLPPPLLARLEVWESQQPVPPPRASVLRTALELWLGMEESAAELARGRDDEH